VCGPGEAAKRCVRVREPQRTGEAGVCEEMRARNGSRAEEAGAR